MRLGAHIGISAGLAEAPATARSIGCDVMQIFSKSPQMWKGPPISDESATAFTAAVRDQGIRSTAVHHSYLINLASPKKSMLAISRRAFVDEIQRADKLHADQLIFHPGAHMGGGVDAGLALIVESLNWAIGKTPGAKVRVLLENAAGQGTALCSKFEELRTVLDGVQNPARVGVALDTCHLFAAGFDFRTPETYGALNDELRTKLGFADVHAFHLNDAKAELASHTDRHENIGKGHIGSDGFRGWVNDPQWAETPGYLETPMDDEGYAAYEKDLQTLRGLIGGAPTAPNPTPERVTRAPRSRTSK
jgi:deoxyribonuclease-4